MTALQRYWFPAHGVMGVGVTAPTETEAAELARRVADALGWAQLAGSPIVDVDLSGLDKNHVRTNLGTPSERGVWFPLGFEHLRPGT